MQTLSDRLLSARQRIKSIEDGNIECSLRDTRPGNPRQYIATLSGSFVRPPAKAFAKCPSSLYCRVSSGKQGREGNLSHQAPDVRRRLQRLGEQYGIKVEIIDEVCEDVSAWRLWKSERVEGV